MVCPYKENYNCPFVDTSTMEKTTSCTECEYYKVNKDELPRHTN